MRLVKTFIERVTEKFVGNGWEVQPSGSPSFEDQYNIWVKKHHAQVEQAIMNEDTDSGLMGDTRVRTFRYCVFYEADALAIPEAPVELQASQIATRWIPTVEVSLIENGTSRKMQAMAGACGVPQGYKLGAADTEPAPLPLFSPDLDFRKYADLFRSNTDGSKSA